MRLGFHYHIPAEIRNGKIYTLSLQGLFIDSLATYCEKVILFLYKPLRSELSILDYAIASKNVELVSLVKHYSIPMRLLLSPLIRIRVRKRVADVDMMLMRAPTPLLPLIAKDVNGRIPYAFLVVGEMTDHIDNIPQARWRRGFLRKYILWNEGRQREFARGGLVLANSAVIFNKYKLFSKKAELVFTTTLYKSDFFKREDTCQRGRISILFSGRIERGKGILEITEAISLLAKKNVNCELNIVGWAQAGDPTPELVKEMASRMGISDRIIFHGKKKVGDELFDYYRQADIFVLASQVAEGFPRTIWEALANSLPVISTPVGSVPFFLKDGCDVLLVEQRNATDIADKIKLLIDNTGLRRQMIRNGMQTVDQVTLEVQGKKICDALAEYARQYQSEKNVLPVHLRLEK